MPTNLSLFSCTSFPHCCVPVMHNICRSHTFQLFLRGHPLSYCHLNKLKGLIFLSFHLIMIVPFLPYTRGSWITIFRLYFTLVEMDQNPIKIQSSASCASPMKFQKEHVVGGIRWDAYYSSEILVGKHLPATTVQRKGPSELPSKTIQLNWDGKEKGENPGLRINW